MKRYEAIFGRGETRGSNANDIEDESVSRETIFPSRMSTEGEYVFRNVYTKVPACTSVNEIAFERMIGFERNSIFDRFFGYVGVRALRNFTREN